MSKDRFNREDMEENQLRKVLIRIDYTGVTTIDGFVNRIKDDFIRPYFQTYFKSLNNNISINDLDIEAAYRNKAIPVSDFQREPVHNFESPTFIYREGGEITPRQDDVRLCIKADYAFLEIGCRHYKDINPYVDFMAGLVTQLIDSDQYVRVCRIGIRKWDANDYDSMKNAFKDYEKEAVFNDFCSSDDNGLFEKKYTDKFLTPDNVKINYTRRCRRIVQNGRPKVQIILDSDGYIDSDLISQNNLNLPTDLRDVMLNQINENLFSLFKKSVTESFLERHGKQQ